VRVALASYAELPDWEVDDRHLHAALSDQGVDFEVVSWDSGVEAFEGFDGCLLRSTWDYSERLEDFLAWAGALARRMPLYNPPAVLAWNTDKRYLRELEAAGLPVLPGVWLEPGEDPDLAALMKARGWERGFLKPWVGAASSGTLRFDCDAAGLERARAHLGRCIAGEGMLLQPYLESVEQEGELSLVYVDGELTHALRRRPRPGDYRVQEAFGALDELAEASPGNLELGRAALVAAARSCGQEPPLLYGRVDFLRTAAGELVLNELELVEPHLFFRLFPGAASVLAQRLRERLGAGRP